MDANIKKEVENAKQNEEVDVKFSEEICSDLEVTSVIEEKVSEMFGIRKGNVGELKAYQDDDDDGWNKNNKKLVLKDKKKGLADCSFSSTENTGRKSRRKNPPRRKLVKHRCYECGNNFENEQLLKVHSTTCYVPTDIDSDVEIKKEVESDGEFVTSPIKQNNVNSKQEKNFKCDLCRKKFKTENRLNGHKRIHGLNLYSCSICTESFSTKAKCNEHVKTHGEPKPYTCDVCGNKYVLRESLKRHYKVHDVNKAYVCEACGKAFSEKISFTRHQTIHTGEKPFACNICGLAFRDPSTMRKHRTRHNEEKPYECETCKKKFASEYDKRKHLKIHIKNDERAYKCEFCNKGFYLLAAYRTHVRIHTGERPHHCEICHKGFGDQRNLWAHAQIHTGVKTLQCDHCGQTFRWHCNLSRHIQVVHLGERLHKCEICGKEFGQRAALKNHMRTHSKEKPFECQKCHHKFSDRSSLVRHDNVHTKSKPYSCMLCDKAFGRKFALKRHMKKHNKVASNEILVERSSDDYLLNIMNQDENWDEVQDGDGEVGSDEHERMSDQEDDDVHGGECSVEKQNSDHSDVASCQDDENCSAKLLVTEKSEAQSDLHTDANTTESQIMEISQKYRNQRKCVHEKENCTRKEKVHQDPQIDVKPAESEVQHELTQNFISGRQQMFEGRHDERENSMLQIKSSKCFEQMKEGLEQENNSKTELNPVRLSGIAEDAKNHTDLSGKPFPDHSIFSHLDKQSKHTDETNPQDRNSYLPNSLKEYNTELSKDTLNNYLHANPNLFNVHNRDYSGLLKESSQEQTQSRDGSDAVVQSWNNMLELTEPKIAENLQIDNSENKQHLSCNVDNQLVSNNQSLQHSHSNFRQQTMEDDAEQFNMPLRQIAGSAVDQNDDDDYYPVKRNLDQMHHKKLSERNSQQNVHQASSKLSSDHLQNNLACHNTLSKMYNAINKQSFNQNIQTRFGTTTEQTIESYAINSNLLQHDSHQNLNFTSRQHFDQHMFMRQRYDEDISQNFHSEAQDLTVSSNKYRGDYDRS